VILFVSVVQYKDYPIYYGNYRTLVWRTIYSAFHKSVCSLGIERMTLNVLLLNYRKANERKQIMHCNIN